jgi:hypothetical protein
MSAAAADEDYWTAVAEQQRADLRQCSCVCSRAVRWQGAFSWAISTARARVSLPRLVGSWRGAEVSAGERGGREG